MDAHVFDPTEPITPTEADARLARESAGPLARQLAKVNSSMQLRVTDPDGKSETVTIPSAAGYLSISGGGVNPELYFFVRPLVAPHVTVPLAVILQDQVSLLVAGEPVAVDLTRGIVSVAVHDCVSAAAGVTLTVHPSDAETQVVYLIDGEPSVTAPSTDSSGNAVIVNVPVDAGPVDVTATPVVLGRPSSVVQGYALPHTLTFLSMPVNQ